MRRSCKFSGRSYSDIEAESSERIIELAEDMYDEFARVLVPSRETSIAITKLEEAIMWANKSVNVNGVVQ